MYSCSIIKDIVYVVTVLFLFVVIVDKYYPNSPDYPVYPQYSLFSSYILFVATLLMVSYYVIILPLGYLKPSEEVCAIFNEHGLLSPFPSLFPLWRDYENFHIICWLGKDLALYIYLVYFIDNFCMWTFFVVPTVLIGVHFIILTLFVKTSFIDHIHYYSQFMWVVANFFWAFGEIFEPFGQHDDAVSFVRFDPLSYSTMRWWCAWILLSALITLAIMYVYWIIATYAGFLQDTDVNHPPATTHLMQGESNWKSGLVVSYGDFSCEVDTSEINGVSELKKVKPSSQYGSIEAHNSSPV